MKHSIKLSAALAVAGIVAAATAAVAIAGDAGTGGTRVDVARSPLGRILVDSKGITLYDFPPDKGTTSVTATGARRSERTTLRPPKPPPMTKTRWRRPPADETLLC